MARLVDLQVIFVMETERAVLIKLDEGATPIWLPKSQCECEGEIGDIVELTLPEWLALKKGLI